MPQYIALLGAINVGGHNVKMARLRILFEELGFTNVATFIASGNVIFDTPGTNTAALETQIEAHLKQALGYAVPTLLRTPAEIAAVATSHPFPSDVDVEGISLYITFWKQPVGSETEQKLLALNSATDTFAVLGRETYWLCRTKISESPLSSGTQLKKALGGAGNVGTMRNVTTVRKLAAKYAGPPV